MGQDWLDGEEWVSETSVNLDSPDKRRTLWIVLALNVAIAIAFFGTGILADSSALIANGLDNSSDAVVYALSLLALSRSQKWKRAAARVSGVMLLIFAVGVILDVGRRFVEGSEPGGWLMMAMAAVAAVVNLLSLRLLQKIQDKDVNLRAATTFSFNDFISNGGIIIAGVIVLFTGANWPDLLVGIAVAGVAVYGGIDILRDAHQDKHDEKGDIH
ncbi:cation diffusion facilitator family transporter [Parasphingorhabdus sp.]|jgi:cobalt-zinc-cadmium efflux system protein|uniref:cation diffusion facilitator family transporter n=1 Tax=Parasphingorhabdus sp. TaxID=2709688 RepID=UPI000C115337|nr:MAG: RND transporter [Sphingopyxis sp.]|tara:strand:- start:1314 stop:1958 length:645 start_codon:yes stop_codon:yes gene_type:complete